MTDNVVAENKVVSEPVTETDEQRATWRAVEVLLRQNAALEREVERLVSELDQHSMGIQKKGYLNKWREREIYFAPKWGLRYFVLQGNKLSYYGDDHERRPRRTIDLSRCFVRDEGPKKGGQFHVFSIYLEGTAADNSDSSLLIRLSSDSAAEAAMWIDSLEQACSLHDGADKSGNDPLLDIPMVMDEPSPRPAVTSEEMAMPGLKKQPSLLHYINEDDPDHHIPQVSPISNNGDTTKDEWHSEAVPIDLDNVKPGLLPPVMLQRVKSASLVLQKSMSRIGSKIMSHAKLPTFNISGTRLSLADVRPDGVGGRKKARDHKAIRSFPAYKPMHLHAAPSPLSNEARPGEYNFRGFFNLGAIILFITHCDLIVNNINKYGYKFTLASFLQPPPAVIPAGDAAFEVPALVHHSLKAVSTWVISLVLNFALEKYASKYEIRERTMLFLNAVISLFNLIMPCYWVWTSKMHPGTNMLYLFQSLIMWMKLISFAHANKDLRVANRLAKKMERDTSGYSSNDDLASADGAVSPTTRSNSKLARAIAEVKDVEAPIVFYPDNLTPSNLLYFMVAPTLCYQLNYPRTDSIRWKKVAFIILRMIFTAFALLFSIEQYIKPTLEGVVQPMQDGDVLAVMERWLKLSIPNTYVWLLVFYFYFHLWLNLLAELTRFGDRMFYKDWWNAKTIDRYW